MEFLPDGGNGRWRCLSSCIRSCFISNSWGPRWSSCFRIICPICNSTAHEIEEPRHYTSWPGRIYHKKLDYMCAHINFIMKQVTLFCVNGMCYRVRELPLLWLCVLELEIHQAPMKSYQAPWPGAKGLQLETEDKGKTLGPMLLSAYLPFPNGCASHQSSAL